MPHDNSATTRTPQQWEVLEQQLGFGNPAGPLWFLGMEEGLDTQYGSIEHQLRDRVARFTGPIRDLPSVLGSGDPAVAPRRLPATPTWKIMARLARLLIGKAEDWNDPTKVDDYIRTQLGSAKGDTLLIDLLPLPAPSVGVWPAVYATRHSDRGAYEQALLPQRARMLRAMIEQYRPKWLICYGAGYWERYQQVFEPTAWTVPDIAQAHDKRPVKLRIGKTAHGTTVLLTPFFRFDALPERILRQLPGVL